MLHFLAVVIISYTSPTLLPPDRDLFIDNANCTLQYQLKMLNMVHFLEDVYGEINEVLTENISLGITVVIFDSEVYYHCVSHTESYMDLSAVFSLHGVLKMKYLIPMNICLLCVRINRGTKDVQVILYEKNVDYYDRCYDEECKDSVLITNKIYLLISNTLYTRSCCIIC